MIKHGYYKENWYQSYRSMMDRCYRKTAGNYQFYGARGIEVCEDWHDIHQFKKWAEENPCFPGETLDRIKSDDNYCPDNCRWATKKQQANNRRNTIYLDYNGERRTVSEWAEIIGINRSTLNNRIHRGWDVKRAIESNRAATHN